MSFSQLGMKSSIVTHVVEKFVLSNLSTDYVAKFKDYEKKSSE